MILAIVRLPSSPDAFDRAAAATGLSAADIRRRAAGVLPRVLMLDADVARMTMLRDELAIMGFTTVLVDPEQVPGDGDRVVARLIETTAGGFVVHAGTGTTTRHEVPVAALELVQRGMRVMSEVHTTTTQERKFAGGRALISGGLVMTKKVQTTSTQREETREPFVLLQRWDGEPDVILYEHRLDYRGLGKEMQPTSRANLELTLAKVRAAAPAVPFDDRVVRPGFVQGLPAIGSVEPVDLALHMVRVARPLEAKTQSVGYYR